MLYNHKIGIPKIEIARGVFVRQLLFCKKHIVMLVMNPKRKIYQIDYSSISEFKTRNLALHQLAGNSRWHSPI